jgi:GDP-L-fucose synthase
MDYQAVDMFFKNEKPEYVILAAAKVGGIIANNVYRADFIYHNIQIQNNVIYHCYKYGVKKLIFLGSSCIYPKNAPQPLKEEYLLSSDLEYTNEPYAIAKIAGIKMCEAFNLQYGTNFISVMPTNLFGPNDNFDLEKSHVLPAIIRKMHLGKAMQDNNLDAVRIDLDKYPIEGVNGAAPEQGILQKLKKYGIRKEKDKTFIQLWGTGLPHREFLHSDDLADAVIFLFENIDFKDLVPDKSMFEQEVKNIKNTHINIGRGTDIAIRDLVKMIQSIVGYTGEIEWDTTKPDGTPQKLMDVSKLNALGWKPKISLEDGVRRVYEFYLGGRDTL